MRILVVEDSVRLADTVADALIKEGYAVDIANDGQTGYENAVSGIYDIVILDLMLPKKNGYEVLSDIRKEGHDVPVLILSANSELEDKVSGFELGADDYVTKPFEMRELLMRIQAIVRRRTKQEIVSLRIGNLELNTASCELCNSQSKKSMKISAKEMQLLEFFLLNKNQVLGKEQILTKVWGFDSDAEYNNVEVYVSFLRKKLKNLHIDVRIRAVRGIGYILEPCDD